jgi:hypothetical protein
MKMAEAKKEATKPAKVPKMSQKQKVMNDAKELVLEMRTKGHEDWYTRKVCGKAYGLVKGTKKGKNSELK